MVTQLQSYQTRLIKTREETLSIRTLYLDVPFDYPAFYPGHVVRVQLVETDESTSLPAKAYCVCSLPQDEVIELCVDLVNPHGVSGKLHQLGLGARILVTRPTGKFLLDDSRQKSLLFIGLGSGVGVVRGMMRQHYWQGPTSQQKVCFYAVNTDETEIPYEEELEAISETASRLEVYPVLQTNGYDIDDIADRIMSHSDDITAWETYVAGPDVPVQGLKSHLIDIGLSPALIRSIGYD
jgi:ferredoxin-NADP reductase